RALVPAAAPALEPAAAPGQRPAWAQAWAPERPRSRAPPRRDGWTRGVDAASRCLPGFRAVLLAPDLARSTARKKGRWRSSAWRRPQASSNGAPQKFAGAIMDDNLLSPPTSAGRRHQSESAQEKAARGGGRRGAGTASDEEHGRYSLRQRYAEGVYSSGTQISGACYTGMTPSDPLWMRRRSLFLCFAADPARRR